MIKHELRSCEVCGQLTSVAVKRPNHVLHAVMSIVTCGGWLIFWALAGMEAAASRPKALCPVHAEKKRWWDSW